PQDDGMVTYFDTLLGGTSGNDGNTPAHEAGHWVGLNNTFQGGCNGGDYVDDTPAESSPSYGCNEGRTTCPSIEGLDPSDNLMDYSVCRYLLTTGQVQRGLEQIAT
ncbi:hypothetical protein DL96DRAFT_1477231, partial [Flagelloscypha sp. PMI_526]